MENYIARLNEYTLRLLNECVFGCLGRSIPNRLAGPNTVTTLIQGVVND